MKTIGATLLVLLLAGGAWADYVLPPGQARCVVVLRNPDAVAYPANRPGPRNVSRPDLTKLGGGSRSRVATGGR